MSKPLVYLAGPIAGQTYDNAIGWREWAATALSGFDVDVLSPMRGKDSRLLGVEVDEPLAAFYDNDDPMISSAGITLRDYNDIRRASAVLFYLPATAIVSIGTMIELGWARALDKPCIVVLEDPDENVHKHPMVEGCAGLIVDGLDQGIHCVALLVSTGL